MPVRATAQMATDKWVQNLGNSTERMKAGVLAVKVAPGKSAAANADKWLQNVTRSKPKFIANVSRVSLASWQQSTIEVGIPRVSQGAQAKKQKYTDAMNAFLPYLAQGVATIDAMPNVTLEDGINRAVAMIRHNAKYIRPATS